MSSPQSSPQPDVSCTDQEVTVTIESRRYRVRGLGGNLSPHQLRVNILAQRDDLLHLDTLDLCKARSRRSFIEAVASELYTEESVIKRDIGILLTDQNVREMRSVIDRAYVIHEGEVIFEGSPQDMAHDAAVIERYLGKSQD